MVRYRTNENVPAVADLSGTRIGSLPRVQHGRDREGLLLPDTPEHLPCEKGHHGQKQMSHYALLIALCQFPIFRHDSCSQSHGQAR